MVALALRHRSVSSCSGLSFLSPFTIFLSNTAHTSSSKCFVFWKAAIGQNPGLTSPLVGHLHRRVAWVEFGLRKSGSEPHREVCMSVQLPSRPIGRGIGPGQGAAPAPS